MKLFAFHKDNTNLKIYFDNEDFKFVGLNSCPEKYATIWQNGMSLKEQLVIRLADMGYLSEDFVILK